MKNNKLLDLLKLESQEISQSFKKASLEGAGTPQEVADRREEVVKDFLKKYFPFPYRIVKGNIIDSFGLRSNSIDCIILNPSHPYTIDARNNKASIIFADGVDYVVEVKPKLTGQVEIERGLEQIKSVKELKRRRENILFIKHYSSEELENFKHIPSFIFSEDTFADEKKLMEYIKAYYDKKNINRQQQFDAIIINNRGILFNCSKNSYIKYNDFEGLAWCKADEDTLALFLLYLNKIPQSEPEMGDNIIQLYLDNSLDLKLYLY